MLIALIYVGFFFKVGIAQPSLPAPAPAGSELAIRRQEVGRLHLPIDRTALRSLRVGDTKANGLRDARPGENVDDSTPVMILHAWAMWCEPCKSEFPLWKELGPLL